MDRFRDLIANMPIREQAFTSKKETWGKYISELPGFANLISDVFGQSETVEISRHDLFQLAENRKIREFIFATIIWGYPAGMRGDHFCTMFKGIDNVTENLISCREKSIENWQEHYKSVASIEGLGLSTYTKFLYFLKVNIQNLPALILDQRLIKVFRKGIFHEFRDLKNIRYDNAPALYPKYLNIMDSIAKKYHVNPGNLEMFLFEFGDNLKLISSQTN